MKTGFVVAATTMSLAAPVALGDNVQINAFDRGWVSDKGDANFTKNYFAGRTGGDIDRNWFAFDLSGVSGSVTSASLVAQLDPGFGASGTGTYELHASSVALSDLVNRVGGVSVFDSMDDGAVIASISFDSSLNGAQISITFNSDGLDLLNSHLGGQVALVGNVANDLLLQIPTGIFGFSSGFTPSLSLEYTPIGSVVPLPNAAGMGLAGMIALGARRRQR